MGRPRQISNEQILEATRETVLKHGPSASLDLVAESLDVSGPAILKRFGSRRALLLEALRPPEDPEWIDHVNLGPDERPLRDQLVDIFTRISEFMAAIVPCLSALRESGIPPHEVFRKPPESGIKALARWLNLSRKKGLTCATETEAAVYAILGALQTRAFFSHMMNVRFSERDRREYIDELATLFTRALTSR